ncbi:uncharacterized protein LOC141588478 [Silene latifolia]|uniref:uncharacterized protein LOC141588478 n=1 Tax=Silene latifolia TaxID=37657 RepID=UPI003D78A83B
MDKGEEENNTSKNHVDEIIREHIIEVPFPHALTHSKRFERDNDLYETLRKCEVNILLINLLKSVLRDPLEVALTNDLEQEGLRVVLSHDVQEYSKDLDKEKSLEDKEEAPKEGVQYERGSPERSLCLTMQPACWGTACGTGRILRVPRVSAEVVAFQEHKLPNPFLPLEANLERPLPSTIKPPNYELKSLPTHLKYVFLGENNTLPLIILNQLKREQEERLVAMLKDHIKAFRWSIADIKGISPSTCMHNIRLEGGAKPMRQPQRPLIPPMMEVVKEKLIKLLKMGIIYPISGSHWLLHKDAEFLFDDECRKAFDLLKERLISAPILQAPRWGRPFEMTDASDFAIGAVLGQRDGKTLYVIQYASSLLNDAQKNYTTTEKEFLAVVYALEKFRSYLLGIKLIIYTDHKAITELVGKKDTKPRLMRWVLLLSEFDVEVKEKKEVANVVADYLSQLNLKQQQMRRMGVVDGSLPHESLYALKTIEP